MKKLTIPNAPLEPPDAQLFEINYFSSKQVIFLIFPKTGRIDVVMSIEPVVLEAPTGIAVQPKQFSRQEAG